ncbi:MAG: succinate dehydrogenase [Candidatus Melainabacteria bacterium HGW-Melainabacteria-1]|nr:MAG: succinate dehydrogenase [Candidatus Melainabacteria bacterium HGW-Melainabacteria-1]
MQQAEKEAAKAGPLASVLSIFNSTIGRKLITGLTGLALVGFLVGHLAGNLSLFVGADAFNTYAHKLESLGFLLYAVEIGLIAVFVFHIFFAIAVTGQNKSARKSRYAEQRNAGKPSRKSISSQSMIYTGIVLGVFTVVHVWMFKFGPGMGQGYATELHGVPARDLYRLVVERFKDPWIMGAYSAVMLLLGVHVKHGFWSAFQSLGAYHPRYTPLIYSLGILVAALFAFGFLVLPLYIYFFAAMPATL